MAESDAAATAKLTGDKLSYVLHRKTGLTSLTNINGRRVVFGGTSAH
jgi:lipopolysaccharide/colanic/teichoic acid biosynthesis glycosyltransferase